MMELWQVWTDEQWWATSNRFREKLKPALTDEFLTTLVEAVRTCNWSDVDCYEAARLAEFCHDLAGKERPNLEPYMSVLEREVVEP